MNTQLQPWTPMSVFLGLTETLTNALERTHTHTHTHIHIHTSEKWVAKVAKVANIDLS